MKYNQLTIEDFIIKSQKTHGDLYDYSSTEYVTYDEKVKIICRTHGEFQQRAKHHIAGRGCRKCAGIVVKNKLTFWNQERDSFLKENFEKMSYSKIAKKLNCCKNIVYKRKRELSLKRTPKPTHKYIPNYLFRSLKKGAFDRNFCFQINEDDIWRLYKKQKRKCALSGCDILFSKKQKENTASVDRIDSKKGYTLDNIQIVHKKINVLKMAFPEDIFISMCTKIAENFKNKNNKRTISHWEMDIMNDREYPVYFDECFQPNPF